METRIDTRREPLGGDDDFHQFGHASNQPESPAQSTTSHHFPAVSKTKSNPFDSRRNSLNTPYHDDNMDSMEPSTPRNLKINRGRTNVASMQFAKSTWPGLFFGVIVLQAIVCLACES